MRVGNRQRKRLRKWVFIVSKWLGSVVQVVGVAATVTGVGWFNIGAAFIVGGLLMVAFGIGLERNSVQ